MKPRSGLIFVLSRPTSAGARGAAYGDEHLLGFFHHLLAVGACQGDLHAVLGLLHLLELGAGERLDAALAEDSRQLFADVFIFIRHQARQRFEDGDIGAEALEDGCKLDADRARADDDQRLRNLFQRQNLHVGQHWVSACSPGSILASEPVARTTFFALTELRSPSAGYTSTECTPSFAGPESRP